MDVGVHSVKPLKVHTLQLLQNGAGWRGSIMVWEMFSEHSLGSLIIVQGMMDQYKYTSVLAEHVYPYMCIVFPLDDGIYHQDNVKSHTPVLKSLPFSPGQQTQLT
ncbi:transposable element Tcb1 transposase [Trichonephila clavipes]|uniref:Transposable element Tcb1 transposase n=1 Tax=Trichonephila clavipes TaxID=2585209 RepID=A0A8X6RLP1_TRICX|nr:transposable element Tcb1 transposase [Trichonephila clavipes]